MATARDGTNPYGDGLGVGGKFKKRPHRRSTQSTPYDRPPIAVRNPNSNGWLSKLVDPAQKLIASGAHRLFASVFRKRLPAPSPSPPFLGSSLAMQAERTDEEWRENHQEESLTELPGSGEEGAINQLDKPSSIADGGEFNELEEILKKKTFTRSEIDRLTTLLHSRSADKPNDVEEKQQPERRNLSQQRNEVHQNTIFKESGTDQFISTPLVSRAVTDEDVGSPAELARAYMGSRPSKVSPSIQNFGTQALVVDLRVPENEIVASKSPNVSLVARHSGYAGGIRNTFVTPRSRGRSAIYNMARTPYSRVHSVARLKDEGMKSYGGPSSSSLNENMLEQGRLSASRQEALKRISSVLENDIGSVGPIRRIRQKSNLLSPKILSLPPPRSALRTHEPNSMLDSQHFSSHVQRSTLSKDTKQKFAQTIAENEIVDIPGPSFTAVPSKSRETASQILQCLDMLVSTRDKSPAKMSTSMLSGQALRSLENVESPKYAHSLLDKNKVDESGSSALDVNATVSTRMATFNGNGTTKLFPFIQEPVPAVKSMNSGKSDDDNIPGAQVSGSCAFKIANDLPQARKRGFHISAHEDLLDADDDDRCNGVVFPLENDSRESLDNECKNAASKSITIERSSASEVKKLINSEIKPDPGTPNGPVPVEKAADAIFVPTLSTNSVPAVDKACSKESYAATFTGVDKACSKESYAATFTAVDKACSKETNATVQASTSSFSDTGKSSSELKFTSFTSQSDKPICATSVATSNIGSPKPPESNKALKNDTVDAEEFTLPQTAAASTASATSSGGTLFSFSATGNNSSPMNGSLGANPFSFNASAVPPVSSGFTGQGSSGSSTSLHSATTSAVVFSVPTAINGSSSSNPSTASSALATKCVQTEVSVKDSGINNLFSAPSGSSPAFPRQGNMFDSSVSSVANFAASSSSNSTSAAIVGSGSSMFSSTSSAFLNNVGSNVGVSSASSTVGSTSSNSLSGLGITAASTVVSGTSTASSPANSIFGFSASAASSAMSSSPLTTSTTGSGTSTQGMPFQFSSSASSPSFSLTGNTSSSGNSLFSSAAPAGNLFNSGSSFLSSSSGQSGSNTGSFPGWEASKSTFGSSFSSSSSSAGFTFAANSASVSVTNSAPSVFGSTTGASASSLFSFTAAAAPSPAPILPFGGNSTSLTFASAPSNNSDQMEDSMAEDTVQASAPAPAPAPAAPLFGQQTASPVTSFFGQPSQSSNTVASMFGQQPMQAATPAPMFAQQPSSSGFTYNGAPTNPNPFPFGNQQNTGIAQNSFPFQASGSLGSGSGFSIGSGGDDKSSRRIVKVNRNKSRKK